MKLSQIGTLLLFILTVCFDSFLYSQNYVPNEVLVKWKSARSTQQRSNSGLHLKAEQQKRFKALDIELWELKEAQTIDVLALVKQYKDHPAIEFIEPNYIYSSFETTPNDEQFNEQWALNNTGQTGGTPAADIHATTAWEIQKESPSVKVAIIDTGIDWKHTDLADNIWQNLSEDADGDGVVLEWNGYEWVFDSGDENGIDDDGNGYVDDFIGWDFRNNDNNPMDADGHGTHIAGIVGAKGNNGLGMTGVTWEVQLAALKILEENRLRVSDAVAAINYAVAMGIPISNNSWGDTISSQALYIAIENAATQNHLFIAAAGNKNYNTDTLLVYPASYPLDNIISVAASDKNDNRSSFSNYGNLNVDLYAPGSAILSCLPYNMYDVRSGTSQAAPLVAGACALVKESFPNKTYLEIKEAIVNSVDVMPSFIGHSLSGGRLNLFNALSESGINCSYRDSLALVALYESTNGINWANTWDLSQPISTWYGITTNSDNCVTAVNLSNNQLTGTIPLEIRSLYNLQALLLDNNQLSGTIPITIGKLANLTQLQLNHNQLSGSIPLELGELTSLQQLQLNHNQLGGAIPATIGRLEDLVELHLNNNQLSGNIPELFERLNDLRKLYLNDNQLSGILPFTLISRQWLEWLYLQNNQLSGSIIYIQYLYSIKRLYLNNNQFSGTIPAAISNFRNIEELYLNDNQLSGSIPAAIGDFEHLQKFHLENNQLTGCFSKNFTSLCGIDYNFTGNSNLPEEGSLTDFCINGIGECLSCATTDSLALVALYTATNGVNWITTWDLNTPISTWHGIETNSNGCVITIDLRDNQLTGSIPPEIGNFSELDDLDLNDNELVGSIPSEIGNLTNLERLRLWNNQLSGSISPTIGNLTNLLTLSLGDNKLTGSIPSEIGQLINLDYLDIGNNQLSGSIPITIGNCKNIRLLRLDGNQFTGSIPITIGNLVKLTSLRIRGNQLSGTIPIELETLSMLTSIDLAFNQLTGTIPLELFKLKNLTSLSLSNNQLTGNIPKEIGNLRNLYGLYLGDNELTGTIPSVIGQLTELNTLYLKDNKLIGTIPEWITNLTNLERLYLNENQFTGSIPATIGNLNNLQVLNLADNKLEGCFPESLERLCTISMVDFSNNPGLPNNGDFPSFCTNGAGKCVDPVWPGDFNNDGVVNNADALYWGLACSDTPGPTRPNASTDWAGQEAPDWATVVKDVNNKHQDGDGNGLINEADLQVLIDNYGKTHGYETFSTITNGFTYNLASNRIGGDTLEIDLNLESDDAPINLHGMACSIDFGNLDIDTFNFDLSTSSLNAAHHLITYNEAEKVLDIALTRTDKTDTLCDGQMGTLWIVVADMMDFGDDILINVKRGSQMRANGDFDAVGGAALYSTYSLPASTTNLLINTSASPVECDKLGTARVNISGGVAPYNIQWSNGATSPTIIGLTKGIYSVTVTDANNRDATYEVEVEGTYTPEYDENGQLIDCLPTACPPSLDLPSDLLTSTYQAATTITASGTVTTGNTSTLKAGESITFQSGFTVEAGATLSATIENCATSTFFNNTNSTHFEHITPIQNSVITQKNIPSIAIKEPSIFITPNPLQQQAILTYQLPIATRVQLSITNLQGTQLRLMESETLKEAGVYQVPFDALDLVKGLYFVRLQTNEGITTKKMILIE